MQTLNLYKAHHRQVCLFCIQPSLMGVHPRCFQQAMRNNPQMLAIERPGQALSVKNCEMCPFRRGRGFWQIRLSLVMNRIRVRLGLVQECHAHPRHPCGGNMICNVGGSNVIYAPEELPSIDAARSWAECVDRYNGIKHKLSESKN